MTDRTRTIRYVCDGAEMTPPGNDLSIHVTDPGDDAPDRLLTVTVTTEGVIFDAYDVYEGGYTSLVDTVGRTFDEWFDYATGN